MTGVVMNFTSFKPPGRGLEVAIGHVFHSHQILRNPRSQIEARLIIRFVPGGEKPPRVGGLELSEDRPRVFPLNRLVVESKKTVGLRMDLSRVSDLKLIGARLKYPGKSKGRRLGLGIETDLGWLQSSRCFGTKRCRGDFEIGGIKNQIVRAIDDAKIDCDISIEGKMLGIGCHDEMIVVGDRCSWQLGRKRRIDGVDLANGRSLNRHRTGNCH